MGCDGGTIPKRDELVKTKKKPEQKDKTSELSFRWQHCALTQAPLQVPVVACELGRMFSKESIIENLLDKSTPAPATAAPVVPVLEPASSSSSSSTQANIVSHIRTLKDVKTLNLTENPAWTDASEKGDGYIDSNKSQWMCPVSGHMMNGKFRFVFPWTCGCVFSERALEMTTKTQKGAGTMECLKCQKPFELSDIVSLNPVEESEIEALRAKMEVRRAKAKEGKKSKKAAKVPETFTSSESTATTAETNGSSSGSRKEKRKINGELNGISGPSTAANGMKKSKIGQVEEKSKSLSKISGNYSVASDPRASQTYKSLFTTSDKAKEQGKAHWVTYNPFYN